LILVGRGRRWGKGVEGYKYCVHMYVNRKMTPVETGVETPVEWERE
jgi:hypothetical protein